MQVRAAEYPETLQYQTRCHYFRVESCMSSLPLDHQVSSVLKDSVVLYALESTGIQDQARVTIVQEIL